MTTKKKPSTPTPLLKRWTTYLAFVGVLGTAGGFLFGWFEDIFVSPTVNRMYWRIHREDSIFRAKWQYWEPIIHENDSLIDLEYVIVHKK